MAFEGIKKKREAKISWAIASVPIMRVFQEERNKRAFSNSVSQKRDFWG